jgi:hypothetical protein
MLLEVAIRYLVKLLVEATTACVFSLMLKLVLHNLKFRLQVSVTTEGWGTIDWGCSFFGRTFLNCRSGSGWRFVCCSWPDSLLA